MPRYNSTYKQNVDLSHCSRREKKSAKLNQIVRPNLTENIPKFIDSIATNYVPQNINAS